MGLSFPKRLQKKTQPATTTPATSDITLELDNVSFWYNTQEPLLRHFSWRLREGESWSILGPSGCGKTTLLYLLAGLRQPISGSVRFHGKEVDGPQQAVGLMLQDYGLLPWYTARQNIEIGLKIRRTPRDERQQIAEKWLKRLEIDQVADQYPGKLSGGQRQRVGLARLLALKTRILLLDEPLSAVDEMTRERLQKRLWNLQRDLKTTMVMVTHNVEEAALLSDNIMVITGYAPIEGYTVLKSPFNGTIPARNDPAFIDFCSQIREVLQL